MNLIVLCGPKRVFPWLQPRESRKRQPTVRLLQFDRMFSPPRGYLAAPRRSLLRQTWCGADHNERRQQRPSSSPKLHLDTLRNTTPCFGTSAVYELCRVPMSLRSHRSRSFADAAGAPTCLKFSVIFSSDSPRLNSPTALEPSAKGLTQISSGPSSHTRCPCSPLWSWF